MMPEAGVLDPADDRCREYERVVDAKYLEQLRILQAKHFSTKLLSRKSRVAKRSIRNFKSRKDNVKPRTLRKLIKAIRHLQNKGMKNACAGGGLFAQPQWAQDHDMLTNPSKGTSRARY